MRILTDMAGYSDPRLLWIIAAQAGIGALHRLMSLAPQCRRYGLPFVGELAGAT